MKKPTKRQKQILDYIEVFIELNHYAPTLEEIKEHFNLKATSTVHEHLHNLEKKGYLSFKPNTPRSIELIQEKENVSSEISVRFRLTSRLNLLRVTDKQSPKLTYVEIGDPSHLTVVECATSKLVGENIMSKDLLVFKQTTDFTGENLYMLATYHDMFILKLKQSGDKLVAVNPHHNTTLLQQEEFTIKGVLIKLVRSY